MLSFNIYISNVGIFQTESLLGVWAVPCCPKQNLNGE